MNKIIALSIWLLTFISITANAQTQKSLVGFQGVPWGSGISTVKAKFPNAKEEDFCKLMSGTTNNYQSLKSKMREDNASCINLYIEDYSIEGLKFYAQFTFDPQNRLTYVTLAFKKRQSETQDYIAECTSAFNKIARLLEARYGEDSFVKNADEFSKSYSNYAVKAWSPLPSEVWIANLSGDKFLKRMAIELNKPESDVCKVQINYSKKVSHEASKL